LWIDGVRVEKVRGIPCGGRMVIDQPPGEDLVVWVDDRLTDHEVSGLLAGLGDILRL